MNYIFFNLIKAGFFIFFIKIFNKKKYFSNDQLTEEYGLMKFDNDELDSNTRLSYYIRLALNTTPDKIITLIKDGWHLPSPNLIISITGGAKNFHMSPKLRKNFQQGLIEAAVTTSIFNRFLFFLKFVLRCMDYNSWNKCWCC
jgi:hypothetical protein